MCGIVAVLRGRSDRKPPQLSRLVASLDDAEARLRTLGTAPDAQKLHEIAGIVAEVDRALRGPAGTAALVADPVGRVALDHRGAGLAEVLGALEARLDSSDAALDDVETVSAAVVACKDAVWALWCDRLRTARAVEDLAGGAPSSRAALDAFHSIQIALSALDRLEVRGRDSAGLHVFVTGHGLDFDDPTVAR